MHAKGQYYTEIRTLTLRQQEDRFEVSLYRIASSMGGATVHHLEAQEITFSRSSAEALSDTMLKGVQP